MAILPLVLSPLQYSYDNIWTYLEPLNRHRRIETLTYRVVSKARRLANKNNQTYLRN